MKDLDFVHVPDKTIPHELLASVGGDGRCLIWELQAQPGVQPQAVQLTQLEPPKSECEINLKPKA